jgi:CheY-like chemotaxis protein
MKGLILLLDDNALDLKVTSSLLQIEGYECHAFTDYREALKWVDDENNTTAPKVIFLDLQMPQVTGYQLIPIFKKRPLTAATPIVILSGKNQAEDVKKAIKEGANDYLVKPIDTLVLQDKVNKVDLQFSNQEFASVNVPDQVLDAVHIVKNMTVQALSEFGLKARSFYKIEPGESIELAGFLPEKFGTDRLFVRCLSCSQDMQKKDFIMQFTYVGITEMQRQCIRVFCKQLWVQSKKGER